MTNQSEIKILVVDDREDNLLSIETILEKEQYTIVKAKSGLAALKVLLRHDDFSLILMDVQMPGMNGIETANIIYERDKLRNIPIIFITAHDYDEEYVFKGYELGGVDYIFKPINPQLLRIKVRVFVELYRKNRQLLAHERQLLKANNSLQKEIVERISSEEKIKYLNRQLVQTNEHLLSMNEELDRFAYIASHDLQEPLRKIRLFSDRILMNGIQAPDSEKYLEKIIASSSKMQSLIDDLLRFSRQSAATADYTAVDLNQLLPDVINEMEISIEKTNAVIHYPVLPVINAVPALVRQLFHNLLSNAIKFRKKDEVPLINIRFSKVSGVHKDDSSAPSHNPFFNQISITDNGIGFDPRYAQEVFIVFKRLHSAHEVQGTGIGLSICKKIMEIHNGYISASSAINEGTTITVGFPAETEA
ncbi:MAG: sensor histidine kinase [Agriterribacter sp.]